MDPETAEKIDAFLAKLTRCADGEMEFTFTIRDPAGNSFVQNPNAPMSDPNLTAVFFNRTIDECELLGINWEGTQEEHYQAESNFEYNIEGNELASFPEPCYACGASGECIMKLTTIPHFKEIILMCFYCESCGNKSVEVKPGGSICDQGVEYRLQVRVWLYGFPVSSAGHRKTI
eukprot:SAG31_NODE_127_length_23612_cov_39.709863_17_plen_175_part_00